ncbi:jmjC domain-containing protein A-like [Amphiura filiformis]|uniref:jmjC domain-containing protein A-like n=1 Tax=Amphiura filiformis TaxID=82378 RepID=UPI003B22614F
MMKLCIIYVLQITYFMMCAIQPVSSTGSHRNGHLKPLGSHAAVKRPVKVLDGFPSPQEFYMDYVYSSVPVVFKDGARRSSAFSKWTDEYLMNLPESRETFVDVENKKVENRSLDGTTMSFEDFVKQYKKLDSYLVTDVPDFLGKDIVVPPPLLCEPVLKTVVSMVMWFSSGGTKSVIHNDDVENINCIFSGSKEFLFMNVTKYRNQIVFDHPEGSYMGTNVESVDFDKYPEFEDMEYYYASASAGDCIYIPYKWIHQVNSIDRNIAVNLWFEHRTDLTPTSDSCGTISPDTTLADIEIYEPPEQVDDILTKVILFMLQSQDGNEDNFIEFVNTLDDYQGMEWTNDALVAAKGFFKFADKDNDAQLTVQDVNLLKPVS